MKPTKQMVPTSTALEARLRIFQPSQKPVLKEIHLNTSWGTAVVKGRLGQRHADVLEAVRACALEMKPTDDGGLLVLVDPFEIRKKVGTGYYSGEQLNILLTELTEALVTVDTKEFRGVGHFIDSTIESKKPAHDKRGRERYLMIVRFGKIGLLLLENDLPLYYNPTPISHLKSGMSQAIARHVLTHKHEPRGGWHLDTLIEAVAGKISGTKLRDARRYVRNDAQDLERCGIFIHEDRVTLHSSMKIG